MTDNVEKQSPQTGGETVEEAASRRPGPAHWIAAVICLVYGFAKINGSQFTILDSELTKPMGDVSGFWLTWYYFGYSPFYGTLIALVQIGAGVLLVLPRTALAGALILLPVVGNIILIDLCFGVDPGATAAAIVLFICLLVAIGPHFARLKKAVLPDGPPVLPKLWAVTALTVLIVGASGFTYWVANYNNRVPTPIDGIWSVASLEGNDGSLPKLTQVFFERNRAFLVVFRASAGKDAWHHFEVDEAGTVRIWQAWRFKGDLLMEGQLRPDEQIELQIESSQGGGRLVLHRVAAKPN